MMFDARQSIEQRDARGAKGREQRAESRGQRAKGRGLYEYPSLNRASRSRGSAIASAICPRVSRGHSGSGERRTKKEKRIAQATAHRGGAEVPCPTGNRMVEVQPPQRGQDGFPIMSFDFCCGAAEEHQLQRSRIVDVRR